jgi:hypothetical protein
MSPSPEFGGSALSIGVQNKDLFAPHGSVIVMVRPRNVADDGAGAAAVSPH